MSYIELTESEIDEAMAHGEARHADNDFAHSGSAPGVKRSKYHVKSKVSGKIISTHTNAPDAVRARAKIKNGADTHSIIKEEVMSQTYELISAMESGKSVDMQASFNEIMSQKITDAVDSYREQIAGNLFKTEAVEEGFKQVVGKVARGAAGVADAVIQGAVHGLTHSASNPGPIDTTINPVSKLYNKAAKKLGTHGRVHYHGKPANEAVEEMEEAVVPGSVKKDKEGHITSVKTVPDLTPEQKSTLKKYPNQTFTRVKPAKAE
jgi:hypothetical protein